MQNDERSGDRRDEGTVMFGVAHGLHARDHAMAAEGTSLLELESKIRAKDRDAISSATMCELGYAESVARVQLGLD